MTVSVKPEEMLRYFVDIVCLFRANHLDDASIKAYLEYSFEDFKKHHKKHQSWCFVCRIFKLLFEIVVGRVRSPQFLIKSDVKISFVHTVTKGRRNKTKDGLICELRSQKLKRRRLMKNMEKSKARNLALKRNIDVLRAINYESREEDETD